MQNVLIIISKEVYSSSKTQFALKIAENINQKGNPTTIFLVEDGVYFLKHKNIEEFINSGITVHAEKWDLKARGIKDRINPNIKISDMEDLFDQIYEKNDKALWF